MLPQGERSHCGVVLSDGVVDACVLQLSEAVILVDLDYCEWSREFVGSPEVFDHEVCDGYGFGTACDSDAPLSGL